MRILLAHSYYAARGGEDAVFETEVETLRRAGHEVVTYTARTEAAELRGARDAVSRGARALWARRVGRALGDLVARERPAVAHFHNIFPNLSIAAFAACRSQGVPVVWTLHNYRLGCAAGSLYRSGAPCRLCLSWGPLPAARYACYHGSHLQSGWVAGIHWLLRTTGVVQSRVTRFVALSEFSRHQFLDMGLPARRIAVKPNHLGFDPTPRATPGAALLYAGRLDETKGLDVVIEALTALPDAQLLIAGVGPHEPALRAMAAPLGDRIQFLGQLASPALYRRLADARALVLPTRLFENCPMSVLEAFAHGVPVVASSVGSVPELVREGINGRLAPPGDVAAWRAVLADVLADRAQVEILGRGARRCFEERFAPAAGVQALELIYRDAMAEPDPPPR